VLGDALWAAMVFWLLSVVLPDARLGVRAGAALAFAFLIELSQLIHTPAIDALRAPTLGHLILGSDFDARDLFAYAAGVVLAASLDRILHPVSANARDPRGRS
jgi:hypothetical protein